MRHRCLTADVFHVFSIRLLKRYPLDNLTAPGSRHRLGSGAHYTGPPESFPILRCHMQLKNVTIGFHCILCVWSILKGACLTLDVRTLKVFYLGIAGAGLFLPRPSASILLSHLPAFGSFHLRLLLRCFRGDDTSRISMCCAQNGAFDFMLGSGVKHRFYHALPWILMSTFVEVCFKKGKRKKKYGINEKSSEALQQKDV